MKIVINNHRKIFAVQNEFSSLFPALKIGFHAKPDRSGGAPQARMVKHSGRTLQDCRTLSRKGIIDILPTMSLLQLKEIFRNTFGLSVEISGRAATGAVGGPVSDGLTLNEANTQYTIKK